MTSELALRADLLVRLEEAGALTSTGLDLSRRPDLTYDQYRAIGVLLGRATAAIRWAVGDWLAFGEDHFGELAAEASEALGISPEGRMELARVARAIPRHRRRASLSWGHHRLVAARWIEPRRRDEVLDKAEQQGWNVRELEGAVRELRTLHVEAETGDADAESPCEDLAGEAAHELQERLLACEYEGVIVTIAVRAPGVEFQVSVGEDSP
jgi:signal transduction histidine kinase